MKWLRPGSAGRGTGLACAILSAAGALGQAQGPTAGALVGSLSDKSGPRREPFFTCGSLVSEAAAGRSVASSLAKLGQLAVPPIEQALVRIEERGRQSGYADNAFWLLQAYAKVDGRAALSRLSAMISNPNLGFLRADLDAAAALALGSTSYVDSLRRPGVVICRHSEPRDALDEVVLAWQDDDQARLYAALGSEAKNALENAVSRTSWENLRAAFPRRRLGDAPVAVAYKFEASEAWAQPPESLDDHRLDASSDAPVDFNVETIFKNASGDDCGRHRVQFVAPATLGAEGRYFVDSADIVELLGMIASCSSEVGEKL
jgi:hypothetical protein